MSRVRYAAFVALWVATLLVAAEWGLHAQLRGPQVFSGSDLGFRVDGRSGSGRPYGTFVVHLNGEWVPIENSPRANPVAVK